MSNQTHRPILLTKDNVLCIVTKPGCDVLDIGYCSRESQVSQPSLHCLHTRNNSLQSCATLLIQHVHLIDHKKPNHPHELLLINPTTCHRVPLFWCRDDDVALLDGGCIREICVTR